MKRLVVFLTISLFLIGFISAVGMTGSIVNNESMGNSGNQGQTNTETQNQGQESELEIQNRIRERVGNQLTAEQIRKIFVLRNRLRIAASGEECSEGCTCTGSSTKCQLENGREMTIVAGNSGNVIIQAKGVNGATNVTLYRSDEGKVYAVTKNNETRRIRVLPDQVRERIRERLQNRFENENITLDEDGTYRYEAQKRARLFFIIPVRERTRAEIDPETGKIIRVRNSWWGFLARDEREEMVGASCGTVTPGQNDACCQNRGYDFWNTESEDCEFNAEE